MSSYVKYRQHFPANTEWDNDHQHFIKPSRINRMQDLKRKDLTSRSSLRFATKDECVLQFYDRKSSGIAFAEVNNI